MSHVGAREDGGGQADEGGQRHQIEGELDVAPAEGDGHPRERGAARRPLIDRQQELSVVRHADELPRYEGVRNLNGHLAQSADCDVCVSGKVALFRRGLPVKLQS